MPDQRSDTLEARALTLLGQAGMLRLAEFMERGVPQEIVARLVESGEVLRIARGLYQAADALPEAGHDLAIIAKLVPHGRICLLSALQYHGLTSQLPSEIWLAIERTARRPRIEDPPLRTVRFSGKYRATGIEWHEIEKVSVPIYGPAKTIVDCFRYRNKLGTDLAIEALRAGLTKQACTPGEIWKLARELRALSVIEPYLLSETFDGA